MSSERIFGHSEEDTPLFRNFGNVKFIDFVVYCLNVAIGSGALKLGYAFRAGLLFSIIINIIVAILSFYSLHLYALAASHYHSGTFKDIWKSAFSEWSSDILAIANVLFALINVMGYYQFLQGSAMTIIRLMLRISTTDENKTLDTVSHYQFLIGFIITIVFSCPFCLSLNQQTVILVSYISMGAFILLVLYVIVRFSVTVSKDGFDPNHEFKLIDFPDYAVGCISSFILAYMIYPLEWPNLKDSRNGSKKGLTYLFSTIIISCFTLYLLMGIFSYFSFFSKNTGGSILNFYPEDKISDLIFLIIGHILSFIMVLFTMLVRINVCRFSFIKIFDKSSKSNPDNWGPLGITFSFLGCTLSNCSSIVSDNLGKIGDLIAAFYMFFIPPIIYLRGHGKSKLFYLFMSIIELIVGCAAFIFLFYYDFIAV